MLIHESDRTQNNTEFQYEIWNSIMLKRNPYWQPYQWTEQRPPAEQLLTDGAATARTGAAHGRRMGSLAV